MLFWLFKGLGQEICHLIIWHGLIILTLGNLRHIIFKDIFRNLRLCHPQWNIVKCSYCIQGALNTIRNNGFFGTYVKCPIRKSNQKRLFSILGIAVCLRKKRPEVPSVLSLLWFSFSANFGNRYNGKWLDSNAHRLALFAVLITGNLMFMSYRWSGYYCLFQKSLYHFETNLPFNL